MASAAQLADEKGPLNRRFYSVHADSAHELPDLLPPIPGDHFVLFLAWDAREASVDTISRLAQRLIPKGLVYLVAWGPDCERVHDIFDEIDTAEGPHHDDPDTVVMTTWHDNEPLENALWFAVFSAWPAPPFHHGCSTTFAAAIASPSWATRIHSLLTDFPSLNRAVGA